MLGRHSGQGPATYSGACRSCRRYLPAYVRYSDYSYDHVTAPVISIVMDPETLSSTAPLALMPRTYPEAVESSREGHFFSVLFRADAACCPRSVLRHQLMARVSCPSSGKPIFFGLGRRCVDRRRSSGAGTQPPIIH